MDIAFYAPLKSPDHPVPSGDRLMARMLMTALSRAGHEVAIASTLRSFSALPEPVAGQAGSAVAEIERLAALWEQSGPPALWFCYHPYYKAPDLIGPALCERFGVPYVTAECSYSARRNIGDWVGTQRQVLEGVRRAAVNICLTERDRRGLLEAVPEARTARLAPFIDAEPFLAITRRPCPGRLLTVAMMRPGDKLSSYRALASALERIADRDWTLDIVGDGPVRAEVEQAFENSDPARITWHGERSSNEIAALMESASLYVWPGHGEAYGLAYLEAQAAGLPVVAEAVAGVPEVVEHGRTGLLVEPGDPKAYAVAIGRLLGDEAERFRLGERARAFVGSERTLAAAALTLDSIIQSAVGESS